MHVYLFEITATKNRFQSLVSEGDGGEKLITRAVFSRLKIYDEKTSAWSQYCLLFLRFFSIKSHLI